VSYKDPYTRLATQHTVARRRGHIAAPKGTPNAHAYRYLLRRYLAPQRGAVLCMTVLLLASIALGLAGPQVARSFIDAVPTGAREEALIRVALLFIAVSVARQTMTVLATYGSERVAWSATNALRADLVEHLLRLDQGFHHARTPGELIERVDGDVSALAGFFSEFVVQLVGSLLLLCGVLVALLLLDARLGLAFTVFAALALALLQRVRRVATPHWRDDRQQSAAFFGYIGDALGAAEDLRSCAAIPYAMRGFAERLRSWLPVRMRAELWGSAVWIGATVVFAVGDAIAYGLGGGLYEGKTVSLGTVYLVVAYTAMLAAPIETIRTQLQDLQRADAAVARVRELLAIRSRLVDGEESVPAGPLAVRFRDVSFAYGDGRRPLTPHPPIPSRSEGETPTEDEGEPSARVEGKPPAPLSRAPGEGPGVRAALDNLSFTLQPGRVLGLLGRTGSGKTTVGRLLFRLYDPQEGTVSLHGVDLRRANLKALRSRVGVVTQDVQLFEASLRDNITFFDATVPDARLHDVLGTLGLTAWLERLPRGLDTLISSARLSGGEAQLVALARVFIKDPGLVILDEASSRLDPATEALLERALDSLLAGRTAIIIAHRLATMARADDIMILEDGRAVEYGPRAQLAADPGSRFAALRQAGRLSEPV